MSSSNNSKLLTPFFSGFEECVPQYVPASEYVQTKSGNKVSKKAVLCGSQNIELKGNSVLYPNVVLRGDLALLRFDKHVLVGEGSVLRPSVKQYKNIFFPLKCGQYVRIGRNCVILAQKIGDCVDIGDNVVVGKRVVIRHNIKILPGSIVSNDEVIPPFSIVAGVPARIISETSDSFGTTMSREIMEEYRMLHLGDGPMSDVKAIGTKNMDYEKDKGSNVFPTRVEMNDSRN